MVLFCYFSWSVCVCNILNERHMIVTDRTRNALASRREHKALTAQGYQRHETDWQIHRGFDTDKIIVDAKVSTDGKYVYTKLAHPTDHNCD